MLPNPIVKQLNYLLFKLIFKYFSVIRYKKYCTYLTFAEEIFRVRSNPALPAVVPQSAHAENSLPAYVR
jgi:hypothetical protein